MAVVTESLIPRLGFGLRKPPCPASKISKLIFLQEERAVAAPLIS